MNRWGSTGVTALALLASLLIIGAGTSSVFLDESEGLSNEVQNTVNNVLQEITTYIDVKNIIGYFNNIDKDAQLKKLIILVKPLIETTINLSQLNIQISNGASIRVFSYNGTAEKTSEDLFNNRVWNKISENEFGVIILTDEDNSIKNWQMINKDLVYLTLPIPSDLTIKPDSNIKISIIPNNGCIKTLEVEIPFLLSSNVVYLQ